MRRVIRSTSARLAVAISVLLAAGAAAGATKETRDYPPAPASGLHGRIAYSTSSGDIWVMNANGSCRHQVTRSGAKTDYDPSWSPDARRLVFSTDRGRSHSDETRAGLDSMFVVNVEGSRQREIEPRSGAVFPAWSPRGDRIAFTGLRPTGQATTIYTIRPDGTGLQDLGFPGAVAEPTWSPTGAQIAFTAQTTGAAGIWVAEADGSDPRQLTHDPTDSLGAWSPDGRQLVYSSGKSGRRKLDVVSADGGRPRRLTSSGGSDSAEAWLRDGRIVFAHFVAEQPLPRFYLIRADGSHIQSLPKLKAGDPLSWLDRSARDRACGKRAAKPRRTPPMTLKRLVTPLVGAHRPPGAVGYLLDHGHAAVRVAGLAKAETRAPMRPTTRFRTGSISKTFTAVLVLQLVGEGKLRLSDSVARWLPGLLPSGSEITVRELLNHTSGLYDYVHDPGVRATWGTDNVPPPRRLVAIAAAHGLDFRPGTRWEYSSTNYQVLGLLVERVSGHSLAAELRRRIIGRLGLRATALVPGRDIAGAHADGYYVYTARPRVNVTRTTFGAWADGAIVSNARDLGRFYSALLGGKLLRKTQLAEMKRTVRTGGSSDGEGAGLGIFRITTRCGAVWGHTGGTAGFLTKVLVSSTGRRVAVFATNGLVDEGPVTQPLLDAAAETAFCSRIGRTRSRLRPPPAPRSADPSPPAPGADARARERDAT
jgi:D-alanyl-D-alanine carboxypeptidase